MDAAFRSFDGDVFLHHQLGFLVPEVVEHPAVA
jgi:hypothetical protein